jgi:hypothetical protein
VTCGSTLMVPYDAAMADSLASGTPWEAGSRCGGWPAPGGAPSVRHPGAAAGTTVRRRTSTPVSARPDRPSARVLLQVQVPSVVCCSLQSMLFRRDTGRFVNAVLIWSIQNESAALVWRAFGKSA